MPICPHRTHRRSAQWAIFRLEWEQIHHTGVSAAAKSLLELRKRHTSGSFSRLLRAAQAGVQPAELEETLEDAIEEAIEAQVVENKQLSTTRYVLHEDDPSELRPPA